MDFLSKSTSSAHREREREREEESGSTASYYHPATSYSQFSTPLGPGLIFDEGEAYLLDANLEVVSSFENIQGKRWTMEDAFVVLEGLKMEFTEDELEDFDKTEIVNAEEEEEIDKELAMEAEMEMQRNADTGNDKEEEEKDSKETRKQRKKEKKAKAKKEDKAKEQPKEKLEQKEQGGGKTSYFSLYALYDGHRGREAVEVVRKHLHVLVIERLERLCRSTRRTPEVLLSEEIKEILSSAFIDVDKYILDFAYRGRWFAGTTATVCLMIGKRLFIANVGDTEAVIGRRKIRLLPPISSDSINSTLLQEATNLRSNLPKGDTATVMSTATVGGTVGAATYNYTATVVSGGSRVLRTTTHAATSTGKKSAGGEYEPFLITEKHRPHMIHKERERIERNGGVIKKGHICLVETDDTLAVSRGLGDILFKQVSLQTLRNYYRALYFPNLTITPSTSPSPPPSPPISMLFPLPPPHSPVVISSTGLFQSPAFSPQQLEVTTTEREKINRPVLSNVLKTVSPHSDDFSGVSVERQNDIVRPINPLKTTSDDRSGPISPHNSVSHTTQPPSPSPPSISASAPGPLPSTLTSFSPHISASVPLSPRKDEPSPKTQHQESSITATTCRTAATSTTNEAHTASANSTRSNTSAMTRKLSSYTESTSPILSSTAAPTQSTSTVPSSPAPSRIALPPANSPPTPIPQKSAIHSPLPTSFSSPLPPSSTPSTSSKKSRSIPSLGNLITTVKNMVMQRDGETSKEKDKKAKSKHTRQSSHPMSTSVSASSLPAASFAHSSSIPISSSNSSSSSSSSSSFSSSNYIYHPNVDMNGEDLVSAAPFVNEMVLTRDDEFLVIGSDGLWDLLSYNHVINLIGEMRKKKKSTAHVCDTVIRRVILAGCRDNCTLILLFFNWKT